MFSLFKKEKKPIKEEKQKISFDEDIFSRMCEKFREQTEKPYYRIVLENRKCGIFDSKVGGLPYWDVEKKYPENSKGEKLVLLAQINFGKENLKDQNLLDKGILQFFVAGDNVWGFEFDEPCNSQNGFRVVYHENPDCSVTEEQIRSIGMPVSDEKESYMPFVGEFGMKFEKASGEMSMSDVSFNTVMNGIVKELFSEKYGSSVTMNDLSNDYMDMFTQAEECPGHRILGHPFFTQWDPREENSDYNTLLFQLDSEYGKDIDISIGDSGIMNFFINDKRLKNLDFTDVLYNWDCC